MSSELTALLLEARRRKLTYGQLVGATTVPEREEIIRKHIAAHAGRKRGRKKKSPGG